MKTILVLSSILLASYIGTALAQSNVEQCADVIYEAAGNLVGVDSFVPADRGGMIVSEACKTWPYSGNVILSAFAYDLGTNYQKNLLVAMMERSSGKVIGSYRSTIGEDAITEVDASSLSLDTARYKLSKQVRAFGMRFNSAAIGASCGEAHWNDELTLFVPDDKNLRPILNIFMYRQRALKGCLSVQSSEAVWEDALLRISVAKTTANGFADLLVTATITTSSNDNLLLLETGNKARIERRTLHYDGKSYQRGSNVPWWLAAY